VIAGRAIYNGNINLIEAQKYADAKNPPDA